ncbi:hypothetical protein M0805_000497 [Coniferiporia weirii]|nr:hypothetical protein M0805_000497 [Coniferiporia weirii]
MVFGSYTASPSASQGTNSIISASCVRDGIVICTCDEPARRFVSNTNKNPDRAFYRCPRSEERCKFWKWEDELPGILPPQSPQAPASSARTLSPPTPTRSAGRHVAAPPSTPGKRAYATMSTGGRPSLPSQSQHQPLSPPQSQTTPQSQRAMRDRSPVSRARLLDNIMKGLSQVNTSNADASNEGLQKERIPVSDEDEEETTYNDAASDNDEDHWQPASKRTRLTIKTETQHEPVCTPPRRDTGFSGALPTPLRTTRRSPSFEDTFSGGDPASPTSFTLAGQRAQERARVNGNGNSNGGDSAKGKQRESKSASRPHEQQQHEEDKDEDAPVRLSFLRPFLSFLTASVPAQTEQPGRAQSGYSGSAAPESYQTQLASIYSHSSNRTQDQTSSSDQKYKSESYVSAAMDAISASTKGMTEVESLVKAMDKEMEALRLKLAAADKNVSEKTRRIEELEKERARYVTSLGDIKFDFRGD